MVMSILDSDLYKFTMSQAYAKLFPFSKGRFEFIDRGKVSYPDGFGEELRKRVQAMADLKLTNEEYAWLRTTTPWLEPWYLDLLNGYKYDPSDVGIIQTGGDLKISIEGLIYRVTLWEVPLMATISELYFEMTGQKPTKTLAEQNGTNIKKASFMKINGLMFADFGTRRRYSYDVQAKMVEDMVSYGRGNFVGTSNVHLAMLNNIKPIGTHAHEWFMYHAAQFGYKMSNTMALDNWSAIYRGDLGIALSDTFTTDIFLQSFDKMHAKLFDGVRHDSGDVFVFADKVLNHYNKLGIDPKSKTIIYSDGLDVEKAKEIDAYVKGRIKLSFGIGTNFSNDVGVKPLNIVIKLTACKPNGKDWINTVKLSDNPGKHTGLAEEIDLCKRILKLS